MRYFCYNELHKYGNEVVTKSEDEIRKEYYPYWMGQMRKKYTKDQMEKYSFSDCLDDWIVINWAWEISEDDN